MSDRNRSVHTGEQFDKELANGPVEKRGCTDCLCLLFFAVFMCGMIGIAGYAIRTGNPELIGRGYDSEGKICGYDDGYKDFPLLYWPAPSQNFLTKTVCVSACPTSPLPTELNCRTNKDFASCQGTNDQNFINNAFATNTLDDQSFFIYDTVNVAGRVCLPASSLSFSAQVSDKFMNSDLLGQWVSDVRTAWPMIAGSIIIAFIIGFVYMIFMRWCVGVLTWIAILFFIAATAVLGWQYYKKGVATKQLLEQTNNTTGSSNLKDTERSEKIIAYVCWGITAITILSVWCLYGRIKLAIGVMKAASDYVKNNLSCLFIPPIFFVILVVFYTYWTITAVYLVSSGSPTQLNSLPVGTFEFDSKLQKLLIYHLIALLWGNAFIDAASQFVIASSVCIWYFSQGTGKSSSGNVRKSVYRLFRYHLGSIAFGSLILAIVQFIRIVLAYIDQKAKQWAGSEASFVKMVLKCMQCYVYCFERFVKFLNKNAYIQIALTGNSFCPAAKDAFFLVLKNPLRFGVLYGIGSVFVFFGKCFIASVSTLIGFVIITNVNYFKGSIYSPFIPTLLMLIFSYTVGALFLNIYGLAADTILACFVVDEEIQRKRNAPPLHCPPSLKNFIDKRKNRQD